MQDSLRGIHISTRVYEKDGVEVLVPMMKCRSIGPFSSLNSMPIFTYGGLLSDRPLKNEDVRSLLLQIVEPTTPLLIMTFSPLAKSFPKTDNLIIPAKTPWTYTHILDLEGGFEHAWRDHFRKRARRSVRSARSEGVEIEKSRSLSDVAVFYRAYLDLVERRGITSPKPLSFYESIYKLIPTGFVDFLLAKIDGQTVGGLISFFYGTYANLVMSVCFSQYSRFNAASLLYCTAIQNAIDAGCRYFDFGPSGPLEGLRLFKEGFGATSKVFERVEVYSPMVRPPVILYQMVRGLVREPSAVIRDLAKTQKSRWQRH